jgi:hypothetical protein
LEKAFLAGLRKSGVWEGDPAVANRTVDILPAGEARGNYGKDDGDQPITNIRDLAMVAQSNSPALIVAAGGLVAAAGTARALYQTRVPFVFLVGQMPKASEYPDNSDEELFRTSFETADSVTLGGVDLNIAAQNERRVAKLKNESQGKVTDANVCLVVNANASITAKEMQTWKDNGHTMILPLFAETGKKKHNYRSLGDQIKKGLMGLSPQGIVVSSDAYFRYYRSKFDIALRESFREWVCYPFAEFLPKSKNAKSFVEGPQLASSSGVADTAYFKLGEKAAEALSNGVGGSPFRKVDVYQYPG